MKLDNRGWGLQELLIGLGILFFSLLLVVVLINQNFRNLEKQIESSNPNNEEEFEKSYKELEEQMQEATEQYYKDIYINDLQEGDSITVTLKSLVRDGYIEQIYDVKQERLVCTGYITFHKKKLSVEYYPYLKCGTNYKTKGYLSRLDSD